jgi:glyoxylase-like metal-dependent hydrolase (beta-lactamase superfamily II)
MAAGKGFDWVEWKAVKWGVHSAHSLAVRWADSKVCILVDHSVVRRVAHLVELLVGMTADMKAP